MKKQWIWIIVAVAFVGLIIGAYFLYDHYADQDDQGPRLEDVRGQNDNQETGSDPQTDAAESEYAVPDVTVYDADGKAVKLSQLRGKPVVFNIWASWCAPCQNEMPGFQAMYEKYGKDVHFMMVNMTGIDTLEDAKTFVQNTGYTFPVYYDTDNSAIAQYYTGSVPVTYFINSKGELVTYAMGAIPEATLEQGIGMIQE